MARPKKVTTVADKPKRNYVRKKVPVHIGGKPVKITVLAAKTPMGLVDFPEYFRSVEHTSHVDAFEVGRLFNVNEPAKFGALKKILLSGSRNGGKDEIQDVKEAIASLKRYLEQIEQAAV